MNKLFFDTETSGFPSNKLPKDHPDQAWIVQIGLMLEVDDKIISQCNFLIQSGGRSIHPGAEKVHGISIETSDAMGISENLLAHLLDFYIDQAEIIIGHNISFDIQMVELLLARQNFPGIKGIMKSLPTVCTMKSSTNLCKLPGKYRYKWPKLTELYEFLFQEEFPAHDALADIQATYRCYKTLVEKGVI